MNVSWSFAPKLAIGPPVWFVPLNVSCALPAKLDSGPPDWFCPVVFVPVAFYANAELATIKTINMVKEAIKNMELIYLFIYYFGKTCFIYGYNWYMFVECSFYNAECWGF